MALEVTSAPAGAKRRAQIEAAISQYPDVSSEQLDMLLNWFRHEASSYDVAMVASKDEIRQAYSQFKADHIDRFSAKDILVCLGLASVLIIVVSIGLLGS